MSEMLDPFLPTFDGPAVVRSVNVGAASTVGSRGRVTGIDKRPVDGPVGVRAPGPRGVGLGGLAGDTICDLAHHGGDDQAVYAYAREDLDVWQRELGRPLSDGGFGENLTTAGLDVNDCLIGERWQVGRTLELEISDVRIPCRTFADFLAERAWVRRFTERGAPGAYLRVLTPGSVRAGDAITVLSRPDHGVTVRTAFRAQMDRPDLLPELATAPQLSPATRIKVLAKLSAPDRAS
ncbi:MOSC domain-containing protein [Nakamurella leprariae]|uniref:MOSC domain-containing protein n=1 Tax=Nakamurella leprariae TaxID=2803911 RepID=A0A938YDE6_9ACTN|nr:MOSC domain-containing protein [Nakamurella leprariae]MBM9465815.1 MOSC domain-containing protein [Nakamurella leprariae]